MNSQKPLRLTFFCVLILSILVGGTFISSSPSAAKVGQGLGTRPWQDKVDAGVLAKAALGQTEFFVHMAKQADLSGAYTLATKNEKGQYVFQQMRSIAESTQPAVRHALQITGAEYKAFWVSNGIWANGNLAAVQAVAVLPEVAYIYPSGGGSLSLPPQDEALTSEGEPPSAPNLVNADPNPESNLTKVNADDVWAMGFLGQGAVVAGADTGVRWTHTALKNQYRGWNGATADHNYNWHDGIHNPNTGCPGSGVEPCDDDTVLGGGHGSHTVGTMVGDDGGSNRIGMAPEAKWIACRNMNNGVGVIPTYMECMEWFIAPTDLANANPDPTKAPDVINNSWGCVEGCPPPALQMTLQASRAAGIFYAVSAGNEGSDCNTIQFPLARYPESFTVGATSHVNDLVASFSSRGAVLGDPTAPTGLLKPNISAPGVGIRSSLRGTDSTYGSLSGTSMAGPHVAGLVALLISANPRLAGKVDRLEDIIEQTAAKKTTTEGCGGPTTPDSTTAVPNNTYGWGRIDALTAVIEALPPVAVDDAATTSQNTPVTIEVLANDSDPDGDTLTVTETSDPANGTATINGDQTVTYTPDAAFTGIDTFTYTICAPEGCDTTSETATVTVTVTSTGLKVNYALTVNGGTAAASSTASSNFPASATINGDRIGANWGTPSGGWNDSTRSAYPDTLEIVLPGVNGKTIDEINVFTLQNNWTTAGEPTLTTPATGEGIIEFIVEYCSADCGTAPVWTTVTGGHVTGNDKAWRQFSFAAVTTTKIRVVVNNSRNNWSRIVEVQALGASGQ